MRARLNLASRPFRNEALPNLAFALALLAGVALTLQHAVRLRQLLGTSSSALHQQVATLEQELTAVRRQLQAARVEAPAPAALAEWRAVKALVDQRCFSWSLLLSRLESVVPPGVRLIAITPSSGEPVRLSVDAVARSRDEGYDFARALQAQGSFQGVYPLGVATSARGEEFSYTMTYAPPGPKP